MNQKGNSLIYVLLGALILALIGLGIVYSGVLNKPYSFTTGNCNGSYEECSKLSHPNQALISPTPDQSNNLRTYTNTKYNFTLEYPVSWESQVPEESTNRFSINFIKFVSTGSGSQVGDYSPNGDINLTINTDSPKSIIDNTIGVDKTEKISIAGNAATKLSGATGVAGSVNFIDVIFSYKGNTYTFSAGTQNRELLPEMQNVFDQILASFKFTDQTSIVDTSSWKTYTYPQFSIKLPKGWSDSGLNNGYPQLVNYDQSTAAGRDFSPQLDKGKLKIEISTIDTTQDLSTYISSQGLSPDNKQIKVDKQPAAWITDQTFNTYSILVKDPARSNIISINFFLDFNNYQDLANQILSTFKFTN